MKTKIFGVGALMTVFLTAGCATVDGPHPAYANISQIVGNQCRLGASDAEIARTMQTLFPKQTASMVQEFRTNGKKTGDECGYMQRRILESSPY